MLRRLQDSILALPCQALQVRNSCRVHTMLLASLDSSCQADDSDLVAVPASGTILEDPKAIRPFHCLDGCMTLLGGCELELIQCNIHRAKGSMHLSQDKADGSVGLGLGFRTVFPIHAMLHGLNMQPKHAVWQGVPC